jgi:putative ribosome biogenesis GTPase RsgA
MAGDSGAYRRSTRPYSSVGTSRVPKSRVSVPAGPNITAVSEQILIAVLGVTGAGKSSFINRATSSNVLEVGHNIESCLLSFFYYFP